MGANEHESPAVEQVTLDRRGFVAAAGALGLAAWVAPAIMATSASAATAAAGSVVPCTHFYAVRITRERHHFLLDPLESWPNPDLKLRGTPSEYRLGLCDGIQSWLREHPNVTLQNPPDGKVPNLTASADVTDWSVTMSAGSFVGAIDRCQFILGYARAEQECKLGAVVNDAPGQAIRVDFAQPLELPRAQIHSLQIIYCCP